MKRSISILSLLFLIGVITISAQCCSGTEKPGSSSANCCEEAESVSEVKAYYFHATRRCATCQAVEKVTRESLQELYGDKVSFESINIEEERDNPLLKKFQIRGQTLLIVSGDKSVNLTNDAFLNARIHPDKLKAKIKTTVDSMM